MLNISLMTNQTLNGLIYQSLMKNNANEDKIRKNCFEFKLNAIMRFWFKYLLHCSQKQVIY